MDVRHARVTVGRESRFISEARTEIYFSSPHLDLTCVCLPPIWSTAAEAWDVHKYKLKRTQRILHPALSRFE